MAVTGRMNGSGGGELDAGQDRRCRMHKRRSSSTFLWRCRRGKRLGSALGRYGQQAVADVTFASRFRLAGLASLSTLV